MLLQAYASLSVHLDSLHKPQSAGIYAPGSIFFAAVALHQPFYRASNDPLLGSDDHPTQMCCDLSTNSYWMYPNTATVQHRRSLWAGGKRDVSRGTAVFGAEVLGLEVR